MRMHGRIGFHHNLIRLFPPETYTQTHPEFFPLHGEERFLPATNSTHHWQPCFTAEGIVDGERVSLPLKFTAVGSKGVWAVWGDIPEDGNWVLAIHGTDGISHTEVSILAALADGNQEISFVKVPRSRPTTSVEEALEAGEAVFVEKPLALCVEAGEDLVIPLRLRCVNVFDMDARAEPRVDTLHLLEPGRAPVRHDDSAGPVGPVLGLHQVPDKRHG